MPVHVPPSQAEPTREPLPPVAEGVAATAAAKRAIMIQGARVNSLKNISCTLPHGQLTVITGPSGSGKSSLAFQTLYAEGQRRYIESMSAYARQFFERIPRPEVDSIHYILPAIALEQKNRIKNARSTVGTATDVDDYLRLLFARAGETICPQCQQKVVLGSLSAIQNALQALPAGAKMALVALVPWPDADAAQAALLQHLRKLGYTRLLCAPPAETQAQAQAASVKAATVTDVMPEAKTLDAKLKLVPDGQSKAYLGIVIDRFKTKGEATQASESLEAAQLLLKAFMAEATGFLGLWSLEPTLINTEGQTIASRQLFALGRYACAQCLTSFVVPSPELFSFNHPQGACPACEGYGRVMGVDWAKVIPNPKLSLADGAIHPLGKFAKHAPSNDSAVAWFLREWLPELKRKKIPLDLPYAELTAQQQQWILEGDETHEGLRAYFNYLETKRYKMHVRITLARYRRYVTCPQCLGQRLAPAAHQVFLGAQWQQGTRVVTGVNLQALVKLPLTQLAQWLDAYDLPPDKSALTESLLMPLRKRVGYLVTIGLGYLSLNRQSRTLSGGESQRIHLAAALGSKLTETLYVLDEPTIGLHARDTHRLLAVMHALRDEGNTVVVVEHDPDLILGADWLIDMGPGSGEAGGQILFEGPASALHQSETSLTAQWLIKSQHSALTPPKPRPSADHEAVLTDNVIELVNATGNNLKALSLKIPLNKLVAVSGVSGSGKSTLIKQTLYANAQVQRGIAPVDPPAPLEALRGLEAFSEIVMVDQSPPQRSSRSNTATFVKAFDEVRALYAATRQAKAQALSASAFSFNADEGRCVTCEGLGTVTIDMQFLADVVTPCPDCEGRRFGPQVLGITVGGKTIDEFLRLTVDEAVAFLQTQLSAAEFEPGKKAWQTAGQKAIQKLLSLQAVGLGYLQMGQATGTLSGGEAQRLKLVSYLGDLKTPAAVAAKPAKTKASASVKDKVLFLFDEPTTGLHLSDVDRLIGVLRKLVDAGHSVIVIEHHLDLIRQADWVIDIGPEGGDAGGQLVAQGPPAAIKAAANSVTGRYL
ncbi:MAG: excinuclease ABC subunit UvrA [Vampirovibrionales bacterium]|nr:excinuclease ABC subunit UvrA [Vampirovibrionales bacterium]